ncbi:non-homologous end-joining DNA ligase [Pseudonocardia spinosispora]|uniref:non-homologous end-joining DNA ligase n=1 Tax=Pseudonocardia spinosispora TaxID=103441 RepID=UPI000421C916|nr:non-homologous end-joining DNA ligase [Pseudonocardia spinosispora]
MSDERDDTLRDYRGKRDFSVTPEPSGDGPAPSAGGARGDGRFVVQRHRARRRHYDLRLEVGGVLASWAVPKGPTLDAGRRRLAVRVEDHPLDYVDFEGVIAHGEYGGGDVIVWDRGTWAAAAGTGDPESAIAAGELHFDVVGEKLAGRFVLVRRGKDPSDNRSWFLVHEHDEYAREGWDPEDSPRSVKTGRTNDEVAASPEARWTDGGERHLKVSPAEPATAASWTAPSHEELAALDGLGDKGDWEIDGREVRLTNLDKVLFPAVDEQPPVTKRDLIRYYAQVGPVLLPYLADRPSNLHRFPDGIERPGFWQKELPAHAPRWLTRWHDTEAEPDRTQNYAVLDSVASLVWMANYGAIELHPWTSARRDVHEPTWALIDIDPGTSTTFDEIVVLAKLYRTALEHLDLVAMPKVTGQRGIQVWVPISSGYTFGDTRHWVERVSRAVGRIVPDLISWEWHRERRNGRARLDYTQNAVNRTLVAPFSVRPAPGAPVSMPIEWDELDDPGLRPDRWSIRTAPDCATGAGAAAYSLIGRPQRLPDL